MVYIQSIQAHTLCKIT